MGYQWLPVMQRLPPLPSEQPAHLRNVVCLASSSRSGHEGGSSAQNKVREQNQTSSEPKHHATTGSGNGVAKLVLPSNISRSQTKSATLLDQHLSKKEYSLEQRKDLTWLQHRLP